MEHCSYPGGFHLILTGRMEMTYRAICMKLLRLSAIWTKFFKINQKNTQYQRAAINRAKFLLAGNEDVRGQLKEILMGINEEINRENMDLGSVYRFDFLDDLVRVYQCSILEQSSLYLAVEGKT